jgi:hypothetical protein
MPNGDSTVHTKEKLIKVYRNIWSKLKLEMYAIKNKIWKHKQNFCYFTDIITAGSNAWNKVGQGLKSWRPYTSCMSEIQLSDMVLWFLSPKIFSFSFHCEIFKQSFGYKITWAVTSNNTSCSFSTLYVWKSQTNKPAYISRTKYL